MSYEGSMLAALEMPTRQDVELALLKALFRHDGSIEEFGAGEHIVEEMANEFNLSHNQRTAVLETIYRKENRLKKNHYFGTDFFFERLILSLGRI